MRPLCILALILAAPVARGSQDRHPDAVVVYECNFTRDVNYDNWPDKWRRHYSTDHPRYVDVLLEDDETAQAGRCLTVHMNGGSALVSGPLASMSRKFSYAMEARIRASGIQYARSRVRLDFCNDKHEVLSSFPSEWVQNTNGWVNLHIGPVKDANPDATLARFTLEVERGQHADLEGEVAIDDIWIARLPKMSVVTGSPFNVYDDPSKVMVTCSLSGIREQDPDILFELLDASSHIKSKSSLQIQGKLITEKRSKASEIVDPDSQRKSYEGSTSWHPPIKTHGFYRVRVTMQTDRGRMDQRIKSIAVVPPLTKPDRGEFGWSLAGQDIPLSFEHLRLLLPRAAVSWVKLPVWYGQSEPERGDELVVFTELLGADEIEVVGVVDRPPSDLELGQKVDRSITIADLLSVEPSSWLPSLDAVLTRLSLRVRWWQFGLDDDTSFADFNDLETEIRKLRSQLFRFGQDVNIGFGWPWNESTESERTATWEFQQFSASPALTGQELGTYLQLPKREQTLRWVLVEPLSRQHYSLEDRSRDLVDQMLAAKIHGAEGIFISRPFDSDKGIMETEGTPGELFLPWRTTAFLLSGAEYLGQIRLKGDSENRLFQTTDGRVLMVVWNRNPTTEEIFLGDDRSVQQLDIWGRVKPHKTRGARQLIEVSPQPTFVVGVNPHVAKMRLSVGFESPRIPSVFGIAHRNQIVITNNFKQGAGGTVELQGPDGWQIVPQKIEFKLAAGETTRRPFEVVLPFNADSGDAPITATLRFVADTDYEFSVFRNLEVGDAEIELDVHTRLTDDGNLIIEQRMINHSGEFLDFKCSLYAESRRRQQMRVFKLGPEYDLKTYRYANGKELLGKELWLRIEEVDGPRVFNHRIIAEE
ncbi:MAG: NEW3 domain-containing protein [Planctomycetota bacterium]